MKSFDEARRVFRAAITSTMSSFYRDFYAGKIPNDSEFPRTIEDWRKIPILTKSDIIRVPYRERLFVPYRDIKNIAYTSGTSGTGIAILPAKQYVSRIGRVGNNVLSFSTRPFIVGEPLNEEQRRRRVISGEFTNLPATAKLAALSQVDCLNGSASLLITFADHLRSQMDLKHIRHIRVHADRMTLLQWQTLKSLYPLAQIMQTFGNMEASGAIAETPAEPIDNHPLALEATAECFIEALNSNSLPLQRESETGEMVITTLIDLSFPVIRYKTGDNIRLLSQVDSRITFESLGRSGDYVRIEGGEIHSLEIERALALVEKESIVDFVASVTNEILNGRPVVKLTLTLFALNPVLLNVPHIKEMLSQTLRVNQNRSYADGVLAGIYAPLKCRLERMEPHAKRRSLIDERI